MDVFVEYAKATPKTPDPDQRAQSRTGSGRPARTADAAVSQHLDWWPGRAILQAEQCSWFRSAIVKPSRMNLASAISTATATLPCCSTENETNDQRIFGKPNTKPYVKDAFHNYVIHGQARRREPGTTGTKAAAHYQLAVAAGEQAKIRLRLTDGRLTIWAMPSGLSTAFSRRASERPTSSTRQSFPQKFAEDDRLA